MKDGSFTFRLPPDAMQSDLNVTYTVDDADICSETVWPDGGSTILGAGLLFWGEDNRNYLQFGVLNNGKFWIARRQDGKWYTIVENVDSSAIKVKPGESNILRVKTSGGVATFFINGTKVRDLRGQAPKGGWRFGLSGDNFDKAKDARVVFKKREGHRLSVGSAALAQQLRRLDREIAEDGVGAGALERHQAFQDDALTVDPAALGRGHDHRVFA